MFMIECLDGKAWEHVAGCIYPSKEHAERVCTGLAATRDKKGLTKQYRVKPVLESPPKKAARKLPRSSLRCSPWAR